MWRYGNYDVMSVIIFKTTQVLLGISPLGGPARSLSPPSPPADPRFNFVNHNDHGVDTSKYQN